jgi:hypothetical protein
MIMAAVQTLYRLVWGGRLFDQESWSCSLSVGSPAGLNLAASDFKTALIAWMTRAGTQNSNAARLDFIKFNQINPVTGRYVLQVTNEIMQNDMAVGANQAGPGQLSVAVSTRTTLSRGRSHAGRFYPPTWATAPAVDTGLITVAVAGGMATSAWGLVADVNTVLGADGEVVVFSKVGQIVQPVVGVRVGRVVDTVRSRRRSLNEDYQFAGA